MWVELLKKELKEDRLGDVAAMMTYYAIFALFPMAIFVVTLVLLFLPAEVLDQAVGMAARAMPEEVSSLLREQIGRMQQAAAGGFAVGAALLSLWSASRGAVSLGRALNTVYGVKETRPWWKIQLTGIGTTVLVAVLLLLAMALLVLGPVAGHWAADRFGQSGAFDLAWTLGRWLLAALTVMVTWALLYKLLPDTHEPFRVFTPGAMFGTLLWVGMSLLFGLYVSQFGEYEKIYGALGAILVFLIWLWLSNLALLLGAELNDVLRKSRTRAAT